MFKQIMLTVFLVSSCAGAPPSQVAWDGVYPPVQYVPGGYPGYYGEWPPHPDQCKSGAIPIVWCWLWRLLPNPITGVFPE